MADSFWKRDQPLQPPQRQAGFLENHPFSELVESGWRVIEVSVPRTRPGRLGQIRTVMMGDHHSRLFTFDVDDSNRMRDHATFIRNETEPPLLAMTAFAVEQLAGSDVDADYRVLRAIRGVRDIKSARE